MPSAGDGLAISVADDPARAKERLLDALDGAPSRLHLERVNQELERRTREVRIFPNAESCLRLVRALAVETHENWLESPRYLNMQHLAEHKKEALRQAA